MQYTLCLKTNQTFFAVAIYSKQTAFNFGIVKTWYSTNSFNWHQRIYCEHWESAYQLP